MKKLVFLFACIALTLASCDNSGGKQKKLQAENVSLLTALSQPNAEVDEIMGTFNSIQVGFRQINSS